ncbi:MAG: NAD(P)-dependent oxidoreductase, partial [Caldilineaceae bacterium]|nr:NAD(P)-dependent oxidoreductase [Caldilineaceae bacterium]
MHVLITGADSKLARAWIGSLDTGFSVRAVDSVFTANITGVEQMAGDLRDSSFVEQAVAGVDALLHLAPLYTVGDTPADSIDQVSRGTYQLANAAADAGVKRMVVGSTLELFASAWDRYLVDESWRPRPQPELDQLCAHLGEVSLREVARATALPALCLRFGVVVDDKEAAAQPFDPRWLHLDDAVSALHRSLEVEIDGWQIYHIAAKGDRTSAPVVRAAEPPFGYHPQHDFQDRWASAQPQPAWQAPTPIAPRPIRKVVVFGAGGPLASAVATELMPDYQLRLTDLRAVEELASGEPQSPGAPLPSAPQAPHEWRTVDVRDAEQVSAACAGMDAIINCSVVRNDPADAFRVNAVGAYNVMRAAVAHRIKRVVHTGPYMLGQRGPAGYQWDDFVVDDVPPRPGIGWVYFASKLAGQEICRIFADHHGLDVPCLTFAQFANPEVPPQRLASLAVSWADSARAIRSALEVSNLPNRFEYFHIGS